MFRLGLVCFLCACERSAFARGLLPSALVFLLPLFLLSSFFLFFVMSWSMSRPVMPCLCHEILEKRKEKCFTPFSAALRARTGGVFFFFSLFSCLIFCVVAVDRPPLWGGNIHTCIHTYIHWGGIPRRI